MTRCETVSVAIEHRMVHFRADDLSEVLAEIEGITGRANGREWITISPWVDLEHLPVVSVLHRLLSARGSKVPEVTWVPAHGQEPAQLGVLHAMGANALGRLAESQVSVPSGWVTLGDHSKRGLLFAVPAGAGDGALLRFALDAATVLAAVPTDDRWVAQVSVSG